MNTITVNASSNYQVLVGESLIENAGSYIEKVCKKGKVAIISDSNVYPLYGAQVTESLQKSGFEVFSYIFPAGEESKNGSNYLQILNFLAENTFTRSDILIALGGGVVGDITGFAAATYLRSVSYVQIPTTLLAMVDSSVGAKTAIDLPAGKNLAGAFYQPKLVLCDLNALNTLPETIFCDGCAEVIKYGVLYDEKLFEHLMDKGLGFDRSAVISRCIELKRNVVAEDEFDRGVRQKLNLGHTFGHGIEAQSNYTVSHGQAVAIGMVIAAKGGWKAGLCDTSVYTNLVKVLTDFHLPVSTDYSAHQLFISALSDKKRSGGTVNLIIPQKIGECLIIPTDIQKVESFIEEGL